ncbi:MAG: hypothetical protein ACI9MR_003432 [Myxococcota bacterium]|jgi:hypothetical protein
MKTHLNTTTAILCSLLLPLAGCSNSEAPDNAPSTGVEITVLPLQLDGIIDATWRITVENAQSQTVWTEDVTSSQFGDNAGAISYVGPCDATPSANPNVVSLTLLSLVADAGGQPLTLTAGTDYTDPGTLTRDVACVENADVLVTFNITLMRRAQQGFFDVAVNFRDIFCSAKLDCVDALLHQGDQGRGPSVVMAFACTTGDLTPTHQYLSEITLSCVDADPADETNLAPLTQRITPASAQTDGNQGAAPPLLFQWARYSVDEKLPGLDKCAWSHALGLDLAAIGARTCTLSAIGTASDVALVEGALPADAVWPVIKWEAEVVSADGSLCTNNALNAEGSGVVSAYEVPYTDGQPPLSFAAEHTCEGQVQEPLGFQCDDSGETVFRATRVDDAPAVAVTIAGVPSAEAYKLPADMTLVQDCCEDACCGADPTSTTACTGEQADCAFTSCLDILNAGLDDGDQTYFIDPDGPNTGAPAFEVYCDMTTAPGGWTLLLRVNGTDAYNFDEEDWATFTTLGPTTDFTLSGGDDVVYASYGTVAGDALLFLNGGPACGTDDRLTQSGDILGGATLKSYLATTPFHTATCTAAAFCDPPEGPNAFTPTYMNTSCQHPFNPNNTGDQYFISDGKVGINLEDQTAGSHRVRFSRQNPGYDTGIGGEVPANGDRNVGDLDITGDGVNAWAGHVVTIFIR